ncbi:hypothetical protein FJ250_01780 [bacterium]|nr:hypothetical protein [bacterium]
MHPCESISRAFARGLAVLMLPLTCLLAPASSARVEIACDDGRDDATGDPLDSNDVGGGGGLGERYQHDPRWPGVQTAPAPAPAGGGRRILLIPVNQGGLLTFRLVIIDEGRPSPEAPDAR